VDALPLDVLRGMVRSAVEERMDPRQLQVLKMAEEGERRLLAEVWGTHGRR
jgi:hypothetical protein